MRSAVVLVSEDLFEDPVDTREEILAATYRALRTHGYADLTIQAIGEEFEKSPSLVYHHYDGKDDLVLALLEFLLDRFEQKLTEASIDDPRDAFEAFLEAVVESDPGDGKRGFMRTLVLLRSQVSHDDAFREHFARSDRVFQEHLAAIVRKGIVSGEFEDVDPDRFSATLLTLFSGVFFRRATALEDEEDWLADVRAQVRDYFQENLYANEGSKGSGATDESD